MKIALTGASGFVGRYAIKDLPGVSIGDVSGEVDIRQPHALERALAGMEPDAVVHLAANSFVPASFADPAATFEVNLLGTLNLLQALERSGFSGRFLYVGSADVYGLVPETALPVVEEQPLHPRNPYAVSKVAAEALCYQWSQTGPFEVIMVRPFNHIGPGQDKRFAVSSFARQIMEIKLGRREPMMRVGDIDVTRDFTDVRDVVRAYRALIEHGRNGEVYNVCSGTEWRLGALLDAMVKLADVDLVIERDPARMRPSEQRRACGSNEKLTRDTGWTPLLPIEQTLREILDNWKRELDGE